MKLNGEITLLLGKQFDMEIFCKSDILRAGLIHFQKCNSLFYSPSITPISQVFVLSLIFSSLPPLSFYIIWFDIWPILLQTMHRFDGLNFQMLNFCKNDWYVLRELLEGVMRELKWLVMLSFNEFIKKLMVVVIEGMEVLFMFVFHLK